LAKILLRFGQASLNLFTVDTAGFYDTLQAAMLDAVFQQCKFA
jgi:hypothetical protein